MAARHAGRATGKLTVLGAGAYSGRPPRVIAGAGDGSAHGGRHDRREHGGAATAATGSAVVRARSRPVSAGAAAIHARPPRARVAARVLRPQSEPCRAAGALLPALLLATAADPGRGSSRRACPAGLQVAGTVFWRVSRGALLLPVMAGGARRGNSAVYVGAFCGSEEESGLAPFQGCAEAGYRAKQDVHKTALCIDRARSIHKLIPVPRPCRKFPVGYCAEGRGRLARN